MQLTDIVGAMLAELRGGAAPPVALDAQLERDLGIDSLARAELALRIEQAFGVRLSESAVLEARTVRDLAAALAAAAPRLAPALAPEPPAAQGELKEQPQQAGTLLEVLDWYAARHPGRVHVTLLEGDREAHRLTYGELAARTRAVARGLRRRGLETGQAVAIMLPTGIAYFPVFLGVLAAGGVPAPLYPPFRWTEIEEHLRRQARILENCAAPVLVTVAQAQPAARLLQAQVPTLRHVVAADDLLGEDESPFPSTLSSTSTALLQYTSGSTGQPKGVVLTHANLLANIRAMGEALGVNPADVFVSWLPLYHDMGLIGAWLGKPVLRHGARAHADAGFPRATGALALDDAPLPRHAFRRPPIPPTRSWRPSCPTTSCGASTCRAGASPSTGRSRCAPRRSSASRGASHPMDSIRAP